MGHWVPALTEAFHGRPESRNSQTSRDGGSGNSPDGGDRGDARSRGDRGDVPGWVMVTVMTAALVVALMAVAVPQLRDVFTKAIDSVTGG
ncbi:hypothetical protein [Frankia sp. Cas8]|uniref:hypothetical protein n=1 Tax=unclassified Frankia TaxID=2632575 RepID=UPI003A1039C8